MSWRYFTLSVAFVLLLRTCTISTLIFIHAFPAHSSFVILLHANKASRSSSLISCLPASTSIRQWLPPLFYSPTVQTKKRLRNYLTEKISPMIMNYNNSSCIYNQTLLVISLPLARILPMMMPNKTRLPQSFNLDSSGQHGYKERES